MRLSSFKLRAPNRSLCALRACLSLCLYAYMPWALYTKLVNKVNNMLQGVTEMLQDVAALLQLLQHIWWRGLSKCSYTSDRLLEKG